MFIVERLSTPTGYRSPLTESPDTRVRQRWTGWTAHAHERAGRQRLRLVTVVPITIAPGAAIAYGLFSS